jgi:hypothetical protein
LHIAGKVILIKTVLNIQAYLEADPFYGYATVFEVFKHVITSAVNKTITTLIMLCIQMNRRFKLKIVEDDSFLIRRIPYGIRRHLKRYCICHCWLVLPLLLH